MSNGGVPFFHPLFLSLFSSFPPLSKIGVRRVENFLEEKEKGPTLTLISVSLFAFGQPTRQTARSLSTLSKNRCLSVMWETCSIALLVCQRLLLFLCFGQFWDFIGVAGGCMKEETGECWMEGRQKERVAGVHSYTHPLVSKWPLFFACLGPRAENGNKGLAGGIVMTCINLSFHMYVLSLCEC